MLLCIWDNGFRDRRPIPKQEHPKDATTQPPRPHPYRLRRHPPGGQRWAAPSGHPGLAPRPSSTGTGAPGLGPNAGPGQHRRQDHDAGGLRPGRRRLHRRRRFLARRQDRRRSRMRSQGALHSGHLPAQLPVGPCPPVGPGEPPVADPGLAGWSRTRQRAIHHRPGLHRLRDLRPEPRRAPGTTATPASGAITRCWPSRPAPARC